MALNVEAVVTALCIFSITHKYLAPRADFGDKKVESKTARSSWKKTQPRASTEIDLQPPPLEPGRHFLRYRGFLRSAIWFRENWIFLSANKAIGERLTRRMGAGVGRGGGRGMRKKGNYTCRNRGGPVRWISIVAG